MSRCVSARLRILPSSPPIQNLKAKNRQQVASNSNWESSLARRIGRVAASLQTLTIRVRGDLQRQMRPGILLKAMTNSMSASPRQLQSLTENTSWQGSKCTLERTLDRLMPQILCWVGRNASVQHLVGLSQRSSQKCLASGWARLRRELFKKSYSVSRQNQASTTSSSILVSRSSMIKRRHVESSILCIHIAITTKMSLKVTLTVLIQRKKLALFHSLTSSAWKRSSTLRATSMKLSNVRVSWCESLYSLNEKTEKKRSIALEDKTTT